MHVVQTMVKHKSRLEREKEVAQQQRQAEEAAQAHKAKRKVIHTPGSWTKQVHKHSPCLHYDCVLDSWLMSCPKHP